MDNCLDLLFDLIYAQHPYSPATDAERADLNQLKQAEEFFNAAPGVYQEMAFLLLDSASNLAALKHRHIFNLGLDFGLSLTWELRPFQEEFSRSPFSPAFSARE
ncbi:hypothetical protein D1159_09155 [Pseudoflavonifractor sp. 524-17]|uniref:hypothetical protein n=1 Tax=Pseudoflavonifractor sp. 524-17 TaxID=2304577 RepID=UPI00137B205F|nr:hypothetical protein [Pseudoflavonifractor sp. 524-17]NCE64751.1 hypothetical protein [Pseudoflavonifractor sp. 524-17]